MQRCSSAIFLTITVTFAVALTGCLGSSSSNSATGGVKSVALNPSSNISMNIGGIQAFSASATDANGRAVVGAVQFFVSVPPGTNAPAPLSIASNGNACAGAWDPTNSVCTPGSPGVALVTAVVNGVSSVPTYVYIHYHIDSLQVVQAQTLPPQYDCFSQGQTWLYEGHAYNNGVDITSSVGPMTFASTNLGVVTVTPYIPPNEPTVLNQAQIAAASPGITQLFATASGTTSTPIPLTTCLVQYLRVRGQDVTGSSVTVDTGSAIALQATAVDTRGNILLKPPLTWSTSNPEVVSISTLTNTTGTNTATARANLGGADVTASCTPPTCNIGIAGYQNQQGQILVGMPVYASTGPLPNGLPGYGAISADVITTTKPPTYQAYAATTMCGNVLGCTSVLFQIMPTQGGVNPIGTTATVPRTPNSMMFNYQSRIYLGSAQGLMYIDAGSASATVNEVSSAITPCYVVLCGTVLAISNDGKQVVVSDNVSAQPQVYIYNASPATGANPVTDLIVPNVATAAAFSPDQSKIFILTNAGTMYVYSTVNALAPVPIPTSGTAAAFSPDGSFAYIAGSTGGVGEVSAFSTCALPGVPSTNIVPAPGSASLAAEPLQIFPSPNLPQSNSDAITQNLYVLEPPFIQVLTAQFEQVPIATTQPLPSQSQLTCNPPSVQKFVAGSYYSLGEAFTPIYASLVGNGTQMIILAKNLPAVLIFDTASGTTTAIPLVNNPNAPNPLFASASTDGSQVYVAACDQYAQDGVTCAAGSVHIVNTTGLGDFQQVPYINYTTNNMCNNLGSGAPLCIANLVAIKPQ